MRKVCLLMFGALALTACDKTLDKAVDTRGYEKLTPFARG